MRPTIQICPNPRPKPTLRVCDLYKEIYIGRKFGLIKDYVANCEIYYLPVKSHNNYNDTVQIIRVDVKSGNVSVYISTSDNSAVEEVFDGIAITF